MKASLLLFLILIYSYNPIKAQQQRAKNSSKDFGYTTFRIKGSQDSINFIVSDTIFNHKKGVFLFCQGSLPTALFWKEDSLHTWQQFLPFSAQPYLKDYDFVIISKPGIPVFSYTADKNYMYIDPVTKRTPQEYYDKSYLDHYVTQADDVIKFLIKQKWVEKNRIVVCGHSQGSKVVSKLGAINKSIAAVIYLAGNPIGRFDQNIRQLRKDAATGSITNEDAQKGIDSLYKQWAIINANPNDTKSNGGDTNKAWISFSEPLLSDLLKIHVPLFVGYGTSDITSDYCDLLPLYFTSLHKNNLTLKPYLGYDHNFNFINQGQKENVQTETPHWSDVAKDIFNWLKSNNL